MEPDFSKVPAGEYLPTLTSNRLKLTDSQTKMLQAAALAFNREIVDVLTDEQKGQVSDYKKLLAVESGGQGVRPQTSGNFLFRATRYGLNHPAFEGKTLQPGKTLVEIHRELRAAADK